MNAARVRRGHRFDHPGIIPHYTGTASDVAAVRPPGDATPGGEPPDRVDEPLRPAARLRIRTEFEFGLDLILDPLEGLVPRSDLGS